MFEDAQCRVAPSGVVTPVRHHGQDSPSRPFSTLVLTFVLVHIIFDTLVRLLMVDLFGSRTCPVSKKQISVSDVTLQSVSVLTVGSCTGAVTDESGVHMADVCQDACRPDFAAMRSLHREWCWWCAECWALGLVLGGPQFTHSYTSAVVRGKSRFCDLLFLAPHLVDMYIEEWGEFA